MLLYKTRLGAQAELKRAWNICDPIYNEEGDATVT
jgi:hypothetical protein